MLNAGHRKGATVDRAANFGNDLVSFEVYCAKMLAGIGVLPATITDRSIPIRLQRKKRSERVARFSRRVARAEAEPIRESIEAWMAEQVPDANGAKFERRAVLGVMRPEMPEQLSDRMQEGCEPLVAVADALGMGTEARAALVSIFSVERTDEKESSELLLLTDVRDIFEAQPQTGGISSERLSNMLAVNGNGWATWYGHGAHSESLSRAARS
jgi:hypothetical protein